MSGTYSPEEIRGAINELVLKHLEGNVDVATLTPQATLKDIGMASLDAVELIFDIEEHFNITFPDSRADSLGSDTLQDLVEAVQQGLQEKGALPAGA